MSESHVAYTGVSSVESVMYAIFQFLDNGGSGIEASGVRWADDDITHAVNNGSGFVSARGDVSNSSYFATNSYMVVESASTMPSGRRWQCRIKLIASNTLQYEFAPRGGWTYGSDNFGAYPTSGLIQWNDAADPYTSSTVLMSASNLDTYGASSTKVEYLRCVVWEVGLSEGSEFGQFAFRVGGYIPTDAVNDTNPACALGKEPNCANITHSWGANSNNRSYNFNVVPPDTDGTQTDLSGDNAYGHIFSMGNMDYPSGESSYTYDVTRAGQWVNHPMYLMDRTTGATVGYFGKYDMFGIPNYLRADGTRDANGEYIVAENILLRWNPS